MKEATKQTIKKYKDAIKKIAEQEPEELPEIYLFETLLFANPHFCLLCRATVTKEDIPQNRWNEFINCKKCIWYDKTIHQGEFGIDNFPCINDNFNNISYSRTYEDLTDYLKERVKLLNKRLKLTI